jgi:hypothetical protein
MPCIIDYAIVLRQLQSEGLKCHYYNGGSFGFADSAGAQVRGWVGPPDETIRLEMKRWVRGVGEPHVNRLADWAARAWKGVLSGNVWIMPASHWSFELEHGNQAWLPWLLREIGINPSLLIGRTNAAAIEFQPAEEQPFCRLIEGLLDGLAASDFTLAFPGRKTVGILHHHKQLWWMTMNDLIARGLDGIE